ncbi:hypothetical protein D3C80_1553270 [compost metagenome]
MRARVGLAGTRWPLNKQHAVLEVAYHLLDGIRRRQAWIQQWRTRLDVFHPWNASMEKVRHRLEALLTGQDAVGIAKQCLAQRSRWNRPAGNHVEVIRWRFVRGGFEHRQTRVTVQVNQLHIGQGLGDDALGTRAHLAFLRFETVFKQK